MSGPFWLEILVLAVVGGLGSAVGELVGYIIGIGAKKVAKISHSKTFNNVQGFRLPKVYVFYYFPCGSFTYTR